MQELGHVMKAARPAGNQVPGYLKLKGDDRIHEIIAWQGDRPVILGTKGQYLPRPSEITYITPKT